MDFTEPASLPRRQAIWRRTYTEPVPSLGPKLRQIPAARLLLAGDVLLLARRHLLKLEPHERRRIVVLVRRGRGRPSQLSERERRELARLLEKAQPGEFVRSAVKKAAGVPLPGSASSKAP